MAMMVGAIESPPPASQGRNKPRLLCRGRFRKMVKKAKRSLQSLLDRDDKEIIRAGSLGYTPYLFVDTPGSAFERKVLAVIGQCDALLADRG